MQLYNKLNIFQKARINLTAFYVVIMFTILMIFSSVLMYTIEAKMRQTLEGKIVITEVEDPIQNTNDAIEVLVYTIDGILLLIIAFSSYFLAGKTLKPIKNSLDAQKKFSADASHDLRTPTAIIMTESEVALQNKNPNLLEYKKVIESNLEEAQKMNTLIGDLLLIARGEDENKNHNFVITDLHNFLEKIVSKLKTQIENKNLTLVFPSYQKLEIKADKNNLERAFLNVLQNAINYTKQGSINIGFQDLQKNVEVKIIDTGVGINEKDLPLVFDRFFKAEHSRNDKNGSGLGLPISKQIIERHGGKITLKSEVAVGTTVTIILRKV